MDVLSFHTATMPLGLHLSGRSFGHSPEKCFRKWLCWLSANFKICLEKYQICVLSKVYLLTNFIPGWAASSASVLDLTDSSGWVG